MITFVVLVIQSWLVVKDRMAMRPLFSRHWFPVLASLADRGYTSGINEDRRFRAGIMEETILLNTSCALCYSMFSLNLRMASHVGAAKSVPTLLVRLPTMGKQSRKWTYPAFASLNFWGVMDSLDSNDHQWSLFFISLTGSVEFDLFFLCSFQRLKNQEPSSEIWYLNPDLTLLRM